MIKSSLALLILTALAFASSHTRADGSTKSTRDVFTSTPSSVVGVVEPQPAALMRQPSSPTGDTACIPIASH
ncbi:MAG: hypothetical protein L0Z50_40695, partial [Verrucomicrobiales bacterium]|nr:hypothetical protein [Verrucomicrobiales bacterium]